MWGPLLARQKRRLPKKTIDVSNNLLDQCMEKMVSVLACAYE